MTQPENVTINGNSYALASLTDAARAHVASIQAVDAELSRLQLQIGIARTARNAYVNALVASLPAAEATAAADATTPADAPAAGAAAAE